MFEPTEAERKKATELGITVADQSGPQLREEISKAKMREKGAIISSFLRRVALEVGVEILPTDRSAPLRRRLTSRIEKLLIEQGFTSGSAFVINASHPLHANCQGTVTKTVIHWIDDTPMVVVQIPSKPKVRQIKATTLLYDARLVE